MVQGPGERSAPFCFPRSSGLLESGFTTARWKASLARGLRELAGRLSPARTKPSGLHGLQFYQRLDDHLYNPIKTPEALAAAKADPVPNRHAVLHGLVAYDSRQSSINALIMTDFVFQVFSALGQTPDTANAA